MLVGDDSGDTGTDTTGIAFSLGNAVWIIYVLAGCIAFAVLMFVGRIAVRKIVRFVGYHRRDKTGNVIAYYRYMCDYASTASDDFRRREITGSSLNISVRAQIRRRLRTLRHIWKA